MGVEDTYRYAKDESSESGLSAELERENLIYSSHIRRGILQRREPSWIVFVLSLLLTAISSSWITHFVVLNQRDAGVIAKCSTADMDIPPSVSLSKIDRSFYEKRHSHWNFTSNEWGHHPSEDPNVDALWDSLGIEHNNLWMTKSQGEAMGIDPKENVWIPNVPKLGGEAGFPILLEVTHQLHCLNEIRKNLWYNHEWYAAHDASTALPQLDRAHINHCLDALRQKLMCDADIGVVTWSWADAMNWGVPNFHRPHRCHNFDATAQFNDEWEAEEELIDHFTKDEFYPPEDAVLRTYRSYFGNQDWEEWGQHAPMPEHNGRTWRHVETGDVSHHESVF